MSAQPSIRKAVFPVAGLGTRFLPATKAAPKEMLPIQSGVGNVANAVLAGLLTGPFENLLGFTEVLQDGMLDLLRAGKMSKASATSISLSAAAYKDFEDNIDFYRERIILRPQ